MFKIGDRVKFIEHGNGIIYLKIGSTGVISKIDEYMNFGVNFDGWSFWCRGYQLELIYEKHIVLNKENNEKL